MQLTRFTDYALRTLLYLGSHPDQVIPASAISEAFEISPDHLAKAAKWLTQRGYVRAARGAGGGLSLARAPASIRIGALVRESEPQAGVLECFEPEIQFCKLEPSCILKRALTEATRAFYAVLDGTRGDCWRPRHWGSVPPDEGGLDPRLLHRAVRWCCRAGTLSARGLTIEFRAASVVMLEVDSDHGT